MLVELVMSPGGSLTMLFCVSLSQYFIEISKHPRANLFANTH